MQEKERKLKSAEQAVRRQRDRDQADALEENKRQYDERIRGELVETKRREKEVAKKNKTAKHPAFLDVVAVPGDEKLYLVEGVLIGGRGESESNLHFSLCAFLRRGCLLCWC